MTSLTIKTLLQQEILKLTSTLSGNNITPHLDAELLLAHTLNTSRTFLYTHPEQILTIEQINTFLQLIARRQTGEPIAYILGHKEFWSLDLTVNQNVLIPRPETELLVELILRKFSKNQNIKLADLGTGSGAIAIAVAYECPNWEIYATDISEIALEVAKKNADKLTINNIIFSASNWCQTLPRRNFDIIVSNPPYLTQDEYLLSGNLGFEPPSALIANENGLSDLKTIITEAQQCLTPGGELMLEHGYNQSTAVQQIMNNYNYRDITTHKDLASHGRITIGMIK